ncbi:MAG: hypothetical protein H0X45_02910, partial [Planctomycetes bacterium]|nr:hypothetical protein [Planctomycetota bacterium]
TIEAQGGTTNLASDTIDVTDTDLPSLVLTLDAPDVAEGATATGTVSRNGTTGELVVDLSSSDTTEATVPASVTIAAGASSATFVITGQDDDLVDGSMPVTISATAGSESASDALQVTDSDATPVLTVNAPDLFEGQTSSGTVSRLLEGPAVTVFLASSDTGEATVPASVLIAAGQKNATFSVVGVLDGIVDGSQSATITAMAGTATASDGLTVFDADADAAPLLTLAVANVGEGQIASGTVSRNGVGAALTVSLGSSDLTEATVPASVVIPAGQTSVGFTISGQDDDLLDGTQPVTISANATGYAQAQAGLSVLDTDVPTTLTLTLPASVAEGATAQATLARDGLGDLPLTVTLTSLDTTEATVPATVTFGTFETSIEFTIAGQEDALIDGTIPVRIEAQGGTTDLAFGNVNVTDNDSALALSGPGTLVEGTSANGTLSRTGSLSAAVTVNLGVGGSSALGVSPSTVTFPAGDGAARTITYTAAMVASNQSVTVTADGTASGTASVQDAAISVQVTDAGAPPPSEMFILMPPFIYEGEFARGRLRRSVGTPGNTTVTITSLDSTEATIEFPGTVSFSSNALFSTDFTVRGTIEAGVDNSPTIVIRATAGAMTADFPLQVREPNAKRTLTVTVPDVVEGESVTATITRTDSLLTTLVVNLFTTDGGELSIPSTVTMEVSETSKSFTVTSINDDVLGDGDAQVSIRAETNEHIPASALFNVLDDDTQLALWLPAPRVIVEGMSIQGTVSRLGNRRDRSVAMPVTFAVDVGGHLTIASITIPANQRDSAFTVVAPADAVVGDSLTVMVTASAAGATGASSALAVVDATTAQPIELTILNPIVYEPELISGVVSRAGTSGSLAVTLTQVRQSDGIPDPRVTLESAALPADPVTVTIPDGQTTMGWTARVSDARNPRPVDGTVAVVITATAGADTIARTVTILDPGLQQLALTTTTKFEGQSGTSTIAMARLKRLNYGPADQPLNIRLENFNQLQLLYAPWVTFDAGQTEIDVPVEILGDNVPDSGNLTGGGATGMEERRIALKHPFLGADHYFLKTTNQEQQLQLIAEDDLAILIRPDPAHIGSAPPGFFAWSSSSQRFVSSGDSPTRNFSLIASRVNRWTLANVSAFQSISIDIRYLAPVALQPFRLKGAGSNEFLFSDAVNGSNYVTVPPPTPPGPGTIQVTIPSGQFASSPFTVQTNPFVSGSGSVIDVTGIFRLRPHGIRDNEVFGSIYSPDVYRFTISETGSSSLMSVAEQEPEAPTSIN